MMRDESEIHHSQFPDAQLAAVCMVVSMYRHRGHTYDKAAAIIQALMDGEARSGNWSRDKYLYSKSLYHWAFLEVYGERIHFNPEPDMLRGILQ